MNVMINCLKVNEYNESPCGAEIKEFTECFKQYSVIFYSFFYNFYQNF